MSKHTPGPWIRPNDDDNFVYALNDGGSNRFFLAVQQGFVGRGEQRTSMNEIAANARLIAAAPTMYEYIEERAAVGDERAAKILEAIHASR